jgi:hypothetical protein
MEVWVEGDQMDIWVWECVPWLLQTRVKAETGWVFTLKCWNSSGVSSTRSLVWVACEQRLVRGNKERERGEEGGKRERTYLLRIVELWDRLRGNLSEACGRDSSALNVILSAVEGSLEVNITDESLVVHSDAAHEIIDLIGCELDPKPLHRSVELWAGKESRVGRVECTESIEDIHPFLLDRYSDPLDHR